MNARPRVLIAIVLPLLMWWPGGSARAAPGTAPATAPAPAASPVPRAAELGPDLVVLDELVHLYEPVPFDHKTHAEMAEMWDGCVTCHHRDPAPSTQPVVLNGGPHTQAEADQIPACKSCHPPGVEDVSLHMPGLKGAYHRQCLSCHREWTGENACVLCHAPLNGHAISSAAPSPDDIVGRMHPPIPEPEDKVYTARFAPVAGRLVLFRHGEHVRGFDMKCSVCHRRDNCSDCHAAGAAVASADARPRPLSPGRTWADTHGPCASCHVNDRCAHCHYPEGGEPPPPFEHASVGQLLDADHASLKCGDCHDWLKGPVHCGDTSCHASRVVSFPLDRPGPLVIALPEPTTLPALDAPYRESPAGGPTTRPTILRIRRGGS